MGWSLPYLQRWNTPRAVVDASVKVMAEELRQDVLILAADIGPRGVYAPERYRLAESFLRAALAKTGLPVTIYPVHTEAMLCINLEIIVPGTAADRASRPCLVVGAHYDSVEGSPAANDNASGVAGVLALARHFAVRPAPCDVRFVLFANEEQPFFGMHDMGSQHYARACRKRGDAIAGMICLETIGCYSQEPGSQRWPHPWLAYLLPDTADFIAFVGQASSRGLIRRCATAFAAQRVFPLLAAAAPDRIQQVLWSDHRGFNECGYPAFMVTDTALLRSEHYHRPTDTPEKLHYTAMALVVTGLIGVLQQLSQG